MASLEYIEHVLNWSMGFAFSYFTAAACTSAILVFMWLYMLSFYFESSIETRKRRLPYLLTSLIILLLFSTAAVFNGLYIYNVLLNVAPGPENAVEGLGLTHEYNYKLLSIEGLTRDLSTRIADLLLIYRCYIVWNGNVLVIILPVCMWITGTAIGLRTYIPLDYDNPTLNTVDLSFLVAFNILITFLISFKLVLAHRRLTQLMPNRSRSDKVYLGIVSVLVESAAPLAVLGVALIIVRHLYPGNVGVWKGGTIIEVLYVIAVGLAPQLIIFRVATGTSWSNRSETTGPISHGIQFAEPMSETKMDDEESQSTR